MSRPPVFGTCALCLRHRQLCRSHYLGKAIHRLMNRESPGGQIIFTPELITQNPRQLVAHLLCRECEERIAKFGEAPALSLINRGDTFPLLDTMKVTEPMETYTDLAVYSGRSMGVDIEALTYYALSLAWRGVARSRNGKP
jgi:hypothetical protein